MRLRLYRILLDAAPIDGNGDNPPATPPPAEKPRADGFEALAAKHSSDGIGLARDLYSQLQAANARVSELSGKVPGDGAVVLTGEDAKLWPKYRGLGKPDELKTQLEERSDALGKVARFEREKTVGEVAQAAGFSAKVLGTLAGNLEFELAEETVKGKVTKVAYVKEGDKKTALDKYAESNWGEFLPALRPATAPKPLGTPPSRAGGSTTLPKPTTEGQSRTPERILPLGRF